MIKKKHAKWYSVWKGRTIGVFDNWTDCKKSTERYQGAKYESFKTYDDARASFLEHTTKYKSKILEKSIIDKEERWRTCEKSPQFPFYCTDAACTNPHCGIVEYRCFYVFSKDSTPKNIYSFGPFQDGSNNIGEYLALVKALMWLETTEPNGTDPVYSDSKIAIIWISDIKNPGSNSHIPKIGEALKGELLMCDDWVKKSTSYSQIARRVRHWNTSDWGEIPADYGRK